MALPASDDFNRANETPLAGNWTAPDGVADSKFFLNSNALNGQGASTLQWMHWTADSLSNSHKSGATLGGSSLAAAGTYGGVATNMQASGQSGYLFGVIAGSGYKIQRMDSGVRTNLQDCTGTPTAGDILRLDSDRSAGTLTAYVNGTQVGVVSGENTYTGGAPGLFGYTGGGAFTLDDWTGDNLSVTQPIVATSASLLIAPVGFV
jgi:hypothetical protein